MHRHFAVRQENGDLLFGEVRREERGIKKLEEGPCFSPELKKPPRPISANLPKLMMKPNQLNLVLILFPTDAEQNYLCYKIKVL